MNESSWNKRTLSNRATRRVAYSIAAGASVAVLVVDAEAAIHYYYGDISIPQGNVQSLDVNIEGDDYDDILLKNYVFPNGNYQGAIVPYAPGKLVGFTAGLQYVTALTAGAIIDATTRGPSFAGLPGRRRVKSQRTIQRRERRLHWLRISDWTNELVQRLGPR